MSEFRIDQITNQAGTAGPQVAGITTFNSPSGLVMPRGSTFRRNVLEDVVQDGLVLYLDAGNDISYPGSGTIWRDLSGNGNDGTLTNGPTYSSLNGGSITFNGTNHYSNHPYSSLLNLGTQFTISSFIKINNLSSQVPIFSAPDVNTGVYTEGYIFNYSNVSEYGINSNSLRLQFGQSSWRWNVYASNGISITDTNWHFVSVTASNLSTSSPTILFYIDNTNTLATYWNAASTGPIRYSSNINSPRVASTYFASNPSYDGPHYGNLSIANLQIYNKALTPKEIQQNFNALRGRFGL